MSREGRTGGASWRGVASLSAFASALAWTIAACKTPDCFAIDPGNRIAITVVAVYEDGLYATEFPCQDFDITPGMMLIATDLGNPNGHGEQDSCDSAAVGIDPFGGWTWTPADMATGSAPTVLTGSFNASNGTCVGYVSLYVKLVSSGDPFAAPEAGQTTNLVMQRTFGAQGDGGAGCPHTCIDTFSVSLERLLPCESHSSSLSSEP
jgi:hypothetical protein